MLRTALFASATVLLGAACDDLRLPALPAKAGTDTAVATASPSPPKPNRPVRRATNVDPALAAQRLDLVRRELRRLVVSEETYYAENGTYTDDLARISFTPRNDADVRFLWLARGGWAASGTHPDVPGRDCVVYVGRAHGAPTTLHDVRQGREGAPVCDGPPPRPVPSPAQPQTAAESPSSPAVASAPTESPATTPDTGSALDMVDPAVQMRVDLRNLVLSQDTYFANQGIYSRRTEPFALQYLWHRGVTISILTATDAGWSARATHASRPGKSCVIWLGTVTQRPATEAQRRTPEQPGAPVCDS